MVWYLYIASLGEAVVLQKDAEGVLDYFMCMLTKLHALNCSDSCRKALLSC